MTIQRLRSLYEAKPFQPFLIHLADGRMIAVQHPEWLAFTDRTIIITERDESFHIIDLLLVTELEVRRDFLVR